MNDYKQREFYRLAYPRSYRPSLLIDVDHYEIEDVSEYGVKVKIDNDPAFMIDDTFMAIIEFPDGREFDLSGQVVRVDDNYAGLQLETPLPLSVIRSEHLYIINHFPESQ
ncbi:MAG: PilZ domain-containing protein [Gammaproteobacteria bacterium]|nr:PilZ domain-containing protein [Gammaproteobacteria bacterium]